MKYCVVILLLIVLVSCQITETIKINENGTGTIEIYSLRDENSIMRTGKNYFVDEKFRDTTFFFQDYLDKYHDTYVRFNKADQQLFQEYAKVKMHIKVDPVQVENYNIVSFDFKKADEIPDRMYGSISLANSLKENYPIQKEYYKIVYEYDGVTFRRNVIITDQEKFEEEKKSVEARKKMFLKYKPLQSYILKYHFPKKIKSVSNTAVIIGSDKKMLTAEFLISDCLINPEITNLEVLFE